MPGLFCFSSRGIPRFSRQVDGTLRTRLALILARFAASVTSSPLSSNPSLIWPSDCHRGNRLLSIPSFVVQIRRKHLADCFLEAGESLCFQPPSPSGFVVCSFWG